MFILSNNKFLLAVFAMAACMASSANAEGPGARVRRRELKSSKKSKSDGPSTNSFNIGSGITFGSNSLNTPPVIVNTPVSSFQQMQDKCYDQALDVRDCDSSNSNTECLYCVFGQTRLESSGSSGRQACIHNINACQTCTIEVMENLYNCEMGLNTTSINTNSNSTTTPDMTTPDTGPTGGGVSADVSSGGGPLPNYYPIPQPNSVCPSDPPQSGDTCNTGGYQYSRCDYSEPKPIYCVCRWDEERFMCVDNEA